MTPTHPPSPNIIALRFDSAKKYLWVLIWLPRDDWASGIEEIQYPDGMIVHMPINYEPERVMYAVIEVIDLNDLQVVAHSEFDMLPGGFFSDTLLYGMVTDPQTAAPSLAVWRLVSDFQE